MSDEIFEIVLSEPFSCRFGSFPQGVPNTVTKEVLDLINHERKGIIIRCVKKKGLMK